MHESMHLHAEILLYGHSTVSDLSPPSISGVTLRARFGAKFGVQTLRRRKMSTREPILKEEIDLKRVLRVSDFSVELKK